MNTQKMSRLQRGILILCALLLAAVLFVPMWRIDLVAPQYPEGLFLLIYPNKLAGNVDIINGLNHYIGMKTLHTDDFIEFKILPYIIGVFAVAYLIVGLLGRKLGLNILFAVFVLFGIVAMVDFWKWEYNYGHNLNPDAAIIVPGMAYQPPLIGYKQLLNFSAYSMPDTGGMLFIAVGVLTAFAVFAQAIMKRFNKKQMTGIAATVVLAMLLFSSCSSAPEAFKIGKDNCSFCKMTISDPRFGAELITDKGKIYKFDDTHCLASFVKAKKSDMNRSSFYLIDFVSRDLIASSKAILFSSPDLKTPMGGNVVAFSSLADGEKATAGKNASRIEFNDLLK